MRKLIFALTLVMVLSFSGVARAEWALSTSDAAATGGNAASSASTGSSTATVGSLAASTGSSSAFIQNNEVQQYLNAPTIFPMPIPMLQGGKVGDVTGLMPKFSIKGLLPLDLAKDRVKKVLDVSDGNIFSRIRLDEIEQKLIDKVADLVADKNIKSEKIRFQVQYKDSVHTAGIGGGAAGSLSGGIDAIGGAAGTLAVLPGMHRSTADPMYILKFYEIE